MATLNSVRIASAIGTIHPDHLQTLLADSRYTAAQVAAIAGTTPGRLAQLFAEPVLTRQPLNWVSEAVVGTPYPYTGQFAGQLAQVYAGPGEPGFTWGAPVYVSDTTRPIASIND
ncbi:hypothetical protein [Rhizobacter fulvus]